MEVGGGIGNFTADLARISESVISLEPNAYCYKQLVEKTQSVRNVTTCPHAGASALEPFDTTPYAEAVTRKLLRGPLSSTLPLVTVQGSPVPKEEPEL